MRAGKVTNVLLFLKAKTPEELVQKMLLNNLSNHREYDYFSPVKDGKGWVVWYRGDITNELNEEFNKAVRPGVENA